MKTDEILEIVDALDEDIYLNCYDDETFYGLSDDFLDTELTWWHGADKIVIDANDEVIKIPIKGQYIYIGDEDYSDKTIDNFLKNGFIETAPCILSHQSCNFNSCLKEYRVYKKACSEGLDHFFAKEQLISGKYLIQEKVKIDFEGKELLKYSYKAPIYKAQIDLLSCLR